MHETTNTRTILFSQRKSLNLRFHREKLEKVREKRLFFFQKEEYIFSLFSKREREREKKIYLFFSGFQGERVLTKRNERICLRHHCPNHIQQRFIPLLSNDILLWSPWNSLLCIDTLFIA